MTSPTSGVSVCEMVTSDLFHKSWSKLGLKIPSGQGRRNGSATRQWPPSTAPSLGSSWSWMMRSSRCMSRRSTEERAGLAAVLLSEAERQVRANGHGKAWLAVVAGNARARAFYQRNGWYDEGPFVYAAAADHGSIAVPCHRYTKLL